jgi:hypothetical protein
VPLIVGFRHFPKKAHLLKRCPLKYQEQSLENPGSNSVIIITGNEKGIQVPEAAWVRNMITYGFSHDEGHFFKGMVHANFVNERYS